MKVWVALAIYVVPSRDHEEYHYFGLGITPELARKALIEKLREELGVFAEHEDIGVFDPEEVDVHKE